MSNIKKSLTRKIGPLPLWAWAGIVFVGIWYYRNKLSAGSQSGTGTGSVGPTPADPQAGQVLQPGESYYDPNTGGMVTAPGGGSAGTDGTNGTNATAPPDYTDLITQLINALKGGETTGKHPGAPTRRGRRRPKGEQGGKRPKHKTKRDRKPKAHHFRGPKVASRHAKPGASKRHRSTASVRNRIGGRVRQVIGGKHKGEQGRHRGGAKPNATQERPQSRHAHGRVGRPTLRQRPVATATPHGRGAHTPAAAGRTSGTPPRTARHQAAPRTTHQVKHGHGSHPRHRGK